MNLKKLTCSPAFPVICLSLIPQPELELQIKDQNLVSDELHGAVVLIEQ